MLQQLIEFAGHQFLFGLWRHFPLVLVGVVILLALFGRVGKSVGVPQLLWHPDPRRRLRNGLALAHPLLLLLIVAFMLDDAVRQRTSPESLREWVGPPASFRVGTDLGPLHTRPLYWYLFASTVSVIVIGSFLLGVYAGLGAANRRRSLGLFPKAGPMLAGMLGCVAMYVAGIEFIRWYHPATFYQLLGWKVDLADASPNEAGLHVLLFIHVVLAVVVGIACSADRRDTFATPAMVVSIWLILAIHAYGFVTFWHGSLWPLTMLVLALVFLRTRVRPHRLRGFGNAYDKPVNLNDPPRPALPPELAPMPWFDAPRPANGPLVLLCVSGPGSAGAVWVNLALDRLNREFPGFTHRVHLITGSGGAMLGAACHVAALQEPSQLGGVAKFSLHGRHLCPKDLARLLAGDAFSPVIRAGLLDDAVRCLLPLSVSRDRGDALEDAWKVLLNEQLEQTFGSLSKGERDGWRPSLVFSPRTDDGQRVLMSNRDLGPLTYLGQSAIGWELFRVFGNQGTLPLATAVRMASGLPVLSPTAELPTVPTRKVVNETRDDGGLVLAIAWLEEALRHPDLLKQVAPKILLVRIGDSPMSPDFSPVLAGIARGFLDAAGPDYFQMVEFTNTVEAPAAWFVPPEALQEMEALAEAKGETPIGKVITRLRG
ncbi:hypothetical protein [Zavarzinella formosa]|uniref:hypothetical protein n=1 Tax=Zavarzinella formosa TaxID=360055 RepID=UPI0002F81FE0|nr:hypothetical protein [Zavarzinella formosa]